MSGGIDFPRLRQAMTEFEAAFKLIRTTQPGARGASDAARERCFDAYASELLPAILGGAWKHTDKTVTAPGGRASRRPYPLFYHHNLFDHPLVFRRIGGIRGLTTWHNCAVIGLPYGIQAAATEDAASVTEKYGVGVWTRPDLSAWYPNWTCLVVAAIGLKPEEAARFGFTALSKPGATA